MKAIRYVLFATALLLFASCGRQPSDIIESSPNGVTGVKMPILVTFKENVEPKEDRIREAVSISPSVDFDVYLSGMRMLRIIPRSPLKYDTRYKVTIDAAKLTGRQLKGVAEFEFATPKLRFAYSDYWLQQSDDMTSYVLVGEVVSSDYAESGYVEKNLKISGLKNPGRRVGALRERHHAPVYRRQHRPRRGSGLHADARFRLRRQQDPDRRSAQEGRVCGAGPQRRGGTARGGGDLLRTAQTEPEPEGPDPLRHEIPHLGRQEPALHLSRIARHGEFRHRNKPERAQQGRAAAQGELYVHGQPAVAGAGDPLRGQRLRPPLVERHVPAVRIGELPQGAGARAENIRQQPAAVLPAELLRRRLLFGYGLRVAHRPRYDRRSLGQGIDQARPLQHLFAGSQPPDNRRPEVDVPAGDQGRRTAGSHRRV